MWAPTLDFSQDVLVVTAPGSGAEIIPFLKTWVNLPMAIGFMIGYAKLVNVMATETLFYTMCVPHTDHMTTQPLLAETPVSLRQGECAHGPPPARDHARERTGRQTEEETVLPT